jgi:hypothetical protein
MIGAHCAGAKIDIQRLPIYLHTPPPPPAKYRTLQFMQQIAYVPFNGIRTPRPFPTKFFSVDDCLQPMLLPSSRRNIYDWIDCRDSAYTLQARICSSRSIFGSSSPQHIENLPRSTLYAIVSPLTLRFPLLRDFQEGRRPRTTCFLFSVVNTSLSIVVHVLSSYVYSFNYS